jgi:hypothetical protein
MQTGTGTPIRPPGHRSLITGGKVGPDGSHMLVEPGEDRDAAFSDSVESGLPDMPG